MRVAEVMTHDPYAAAVSTSVRKVFDLLEKADVRHLPIVDGDALVGIISDRDLGRMVPSTLDYLERPHEMELALSQPIANLMHEDVFFVNPETELGEAVDLMLDHKIGAVPVVEPHTLKLVGIVSYVDALRAARDSL